MGTNVDEDDDEEPFRLADLIRAWLKDTYPGFIVVRDVYAGLWLMQKANGLQDHAISLALSRARINPTLDISLVEYTEGTDPADRRLIKWIFTYTIMEDRIQDAFQHDVMHAYDESFIKSLKEKIDSVIADPEHGWRKLREHYQSTNN